MTRGPFSGRFEFDRSRSNSMVLLSVPIGLHWILMILYIDKNSSFSVFPMRYRFCMVSVGKRNAAIRLDKQNG